MSLNPINASGASQASRVSTDLPEPTNDNIEDAIKARVKALVNYAAQKESASGKVVINYTVDGNGQLQASVDVSNWDSYNKEEFAQKVTTAVERLKFKKTADGQPVKGSVSVKSA